MITPKLYDVIRKPVVTEKSTAAAENNKVIFRIATDATKEDVRKAVENIFKVKVTKVNTLNVKGKTKAFRGRLGTRQDYKKAVVTLAEGQNIDLTAGV